MLIVGLTGGIASGKTTVSDLFAHLGAKVIDADVAAREVVAPGSEGLAYICRQFGDKMLTPKGTLDRQALRRHIFADDAARKQLEGFLHPRIRARMWEQLATGDFPYALMVVPLLVETDFARLVDRILVVDTPVEVQRRRLIERDNCTAEQADAILAAQTTRERRLAAADDVVVNDARIDQVEPQVHALHQSYVQLSRNNANN